MASQIITQYDSPHQFEPLLPDEGSLGPLLEQASDLVLQASTSTTGKAARTRSP